MRVKFLFAFFIFVTIFSCGPSKQEIEKRAQELVDSITKAKTEACFFSHPWQRAFDSRGDFDFEFNNAHTGVLQRPVSLEEVTVEWAISDDAKLLSVVFVLNKNKKLDFKIISCSEDKIVLKSGDGVMTFFPPLDTNFIFSNDSNDTTLGNSTNESLSTRDLLLGKWISGDETWEIKNSSIVFYYNDKKVDEQTFNLSDDVCISHSTLVSKKDGFLSTNDGMCYAIIKITTNELKLSYVVKGNLLTFTKTK